MAWHDTSLRLAREGAELDSLQAQVEGQRSVQALQYAKSEAQLASWRHRLEDAEEMHNRDVLQLKHCRRSPALLYRRLRCCTVCYPAARRARDGTACNVSRLWQK